MSIDPRITHPTKHRLIAEGLASVQGGGASEVYTDDILDASFFFLGKNFSRQVIHKNFN